MNYQNLKDLQYENICGELKYLSDKIFGDIYDDEISKLKYSLIKNN